MNIIDLQERLKDLPEQALMREMQMPSGTAPQFLVLSELKRRKRMRDDYKRQQAQGMQTVAEEAITAAGAPAAGIMQMSRAMAPRSAIAQNTGVNDMMQQESVRAPQPEQPMMMADGGVLNMQPGGFTDRQQQGYLIFLEDMGLADSPESQQMYLRMMERQQERGVSPQIFMPGIDRAPESMSLADVSTDISAFMPGAEVSRPTMAAAPVMGAAPSVGAVDFDASVSAVPEAPPLFSRDIMVQLSEMGVDPEDFARLSADEQQNILNFEDITDPMRQRFAESYEAEEIAQTDAPTEGRTTAAEELAEINQRLSDPNLSDRARGFLENRKAILESQVQIGEAPSFLMEQINRGAAGVRSVLDPLISGGISYFDPDAAESFAETGQQAEEYFTSQAEESAAEREARLAALGIGDEEVFDEAPPPVEEQALSFGLDGLNIPGSGTPLSFGGVTPSAADIPLSTGREATFEPTPEFPLGTPVGDPAVSTSSATVGADKTGGGGAGGYGGIESRIARMLEERERSAEADKWLALAQTGLALMASNQPTIGGAIGEAGLAGVGALQKARSQYDKDIMSLLDMQAGIQRARSAAARAGSSTSDLNSRIDDARQELSALNSEARSYRRIDVDDFGEARLVDLTPQQLRADIIAAQDRLARLNALRSGSAATAQFDATAQ